MLKPCYEFASPALRAFQYGRLIISRLRTGSWRNQLNNEAGPYKSLQRACRSEFSEKRCKHADRSDLRSPRFCVWDPASR